MIVTVWAIIPESKSISLTRFSVSKFTFHFAMKDITVAIHEKEDYNSVCSKTSSKYFAFGIIIAGSPGGLKCNEKGMYRKNEI